MPRPVAGDSPIRTISLLISDFNIDVLKGYLVNDQSQPAVEAAAVSYAPVVPTLLDKNQEIWDQFYDFAVVWTRPQAVIDEFGKLLNFEQVGSEEILTQVDRYAQTLQNSLGQVKTLFRFLEYPAACFGVQSM